MALKAQLDCCTSPAGVSGLISPGAEGIWRISLKSMESGQLLQVVLLHLDLHMPMK